MTRLLYRYERPIDHLGCGSSWCHGCGTSVAACCENAAIPGSGFRHGVKGLARIVFGVMGDSRGHLTQALAVAREMSAHEFLFIGGGQVLGLRDLGFQVEEVPMPGTYYCNNRVDFDATLSNGIRVLFFSHKTIRRVCDITREFDPHLVLTSYEYFAPQVAKKLGVTSISIDNQHFLSK